MLVLYETALGFCLFKITDSGKIGSPELWKEFETAEKANRLLKLRAIHRFTTTANAVEDITAMQEGKLTKSLSKFLTKEVVERGKGKDKLFVVDPKLGSSISDKLGITVESKILSLDLFRGIRSQLANLLDGLDPADLTTMNLGLSHSLSRFKLKFSPDKVDTMVVQAIALLDDLDKEINIYSMRVKEWYGWHFPEMGKIIVDNLAYAKVVKLMGFRTNASSTDFSSILPEELESALKLASEISMGTEISDSDINHIHSLCDQIISITAYRAQLAEYLRNRMHALAPNLTALVGDLVGARLISHAGSLLNLAKQPASTVQILGAEKALFRALKTKHDTPKYGLIYHASLIGQAPQKLKGKMARMVATKAALSIRVDALADADTKSSAEASTIGAENRAKLESRLRALEFRADLNPKPGDAPRPPSRKFQIKSETNAYNIATDAVGFLPTQRAQEMAVDAMMDVKEEKRKAKEERRKAKEEKKKRKLSEDEQEDVEMEVEVEVEETVEEKKERKRLKKRAKAIAEAQKGVAVMEINEEKGEKKKKKEKEEEEEEEEEEEKKERKRLKKEAKASSASTEPNGSKKRKQIEDSDEQKKKKKKKSES